MFKSSGMQGRFNGGVLGPEMAGRVDIGKYSTGCSSMVNFIPTVQGPAKRRGGTKFVTEVKNSSTKTWLAKFEFNSTQAYVLEFGNYYVRLYTNNGALLGTERTITGISKANPGVVTYSSASDPANGDYMFLAGIVGMTELNNQFFLIANVNGGANTFELRDIDNSAVDTSAFSTYVSGGTCSTVITVVTPYATDDLVNSDGGFALSMVQSGDILYICHPNYWPRRLVRQSNTSWTLQLAFVWDVAISVFAPTGPFDDYDPDQATTMYASASTGSVTITSSVDFFTAAHVGRFIMLENKKANTIKPWETGKSITTGDYRRSDGKTYKALNTATTGSNKPVHSSGAEYDGNSGVQWQYKDPGYGYAQIVIITDAKNAVCLVSYKNQIPDACVGSGNATTRWALGSWSETNGPSHVAFFRNRLCLARASDRKVWFSVAGDYENFSNRDSGGQVTDDMAITLTIDSDQANEITHLIASDSLIIGTIAGEHTCREMTDSKPFAPSNYKVTAVSHFGSRAVHPCRVGGSVLFVQRSGRSVREIIYDAIQANYKSLDMSVLVPSLVHRGKHICQMAFQKEPNSVIWCVLSDGSVLGFSFNREQFQEPPFGGWHTHTLGGGGVVESVVVVPAPDNSRDDVWFVVSRTIDGVTRRYIEFMQPEYEAGDDQESCFYLDCGLSYSGSPVTQISGLRHLEGKAVDILADGAVHPSRVVTDGVVSLQWSASVVNVGLPCPAEIVTMKYNVNGRSGGTQGLTKRINKLIVRLLNTLGGCVGSSSGNMAELHFRSSGDHMDSAPPIFTGDKIITWPAGYDRDAVMRYENDQPLPATIVAFMPEVGVYD